MDYHSTYKALYLNKNNCVEFIIKNDKCYQFVKYVLRSFTWNNKYTNDEVVQLEVYKILDDKIRKLKKIYKKLILLSNLIDNAIFEFNFCDVQMEKGKYLFRISSNVQSNTFAIAVYDNDWGFNNGPNFIVMETNGNIIQNNNITKIVSQLMVKNF